MATGKAARAVIVIEDGSDEEEEAHVFPKKKAGRRPEHMDRASWKLIQQIQANDEGDGLGTKGKACIVFKS